MNVCCPWRREILLILLISLVLANAASNSVTYIGGTSEAFRAGEEYRLELNQANQLRLGQKAKTLEIPYTQISSLEYGQKVDRRYLEAILVSPLFLLSKKRAHYLTIHYKDEKGVDQAMVLKIPSSSVRPTLASLEARTGLRVKVQDDEARKAYRG
ncbi:MAG: hypothetical protein OHK0021_18430 [Bryobacter sp.]|nr:hypothetical protein [Bryobacter sp.]